jgi:cellulose synthase/poly-beta-1,6-N-acetylglucosamine synthase-like glycosyltransferase
MVGDGFFLAINIFYAFSLIFKATIVGIGHLLNNSIKASKGHEHLKDKELPLYSILVPLFREKESTIFNLVNAIRKLDYPQSKLDVKLIVEASDQDTTEIVKNMSLENYFEIIQVPESHPQTKPKACNYALKFVRGEYVTIYDAEDVPDPLQLKKVLAAFKETPEHVVCVQAKLNYYNRNENLLTRMFSLEYAVWFEFMLRGLEALNVPIPLGGTSNHFPVAILKDMLMGWDPYNVTEDADLGVRLAQKGYKTTIVNSTTLEEAPVDMKNWLRQRSRWIKGYIQTYVVHMREPLKLLRTVGLKGFIGFQFFVGAPAVVFITLPFMVSITIFSAFAPLGFADWVFMLAFINFIASVVLHVGFGMMVVVTKKWPELKMYTLCFPFYWVLHSLASFKAVWQLIFRPHYWEKTDHGLTKHIPESQEL